MTERFRPAPPTTGVAWNPQPLSISDPASDKAVKPVSPPDTQPLDASTPLRDNLAIEVTGAVQSLEQIFVAHWGALLSSIQPVIMAADGPGKACVMIDNHLASGELTQEEAELQYWRVAEIYKIAGRATSALYAYERLYVALLNEQERQGRRLHKGYPLVRISEVHGLLGNPWLSERYLMLTLVEDAITDEGVCHRDHGVFWRIWPHKFGNEGRIDEIYRQVHGLRESVYEKWRWCPESALLELGDDWRTSKPQESESLQYRCNTHFIKQLIKDVDDAGGSDGKTLELVAQYLLSCIPGAIARRRQATSSTDYDVFCVLEGELTDFRDDLGRHWIAECKHVRTALGYSAVAKFARVLDSAKCKAGILFATKGVSGSSRRMQSEREIAKLYQQRGIAIIIITLDDLRAVAQGDNFISLLRSRYERVRHDFMKL